MILVRCTVCLILLLSSFSLLGQLFSKGQSLEAQIFGGRLVKHTPKIIFDIKEPSYGFMLSWIQQTDGSKEWHRQHRLPRIGFSTLYYDLGEKDLFHQSLIEISGPRIVELIVRIAVFILMIYSL